MTTNFAQILLPCTLFVPSFEEHKKHVIEVVLKLSVLNRNKKINSIFGGGIVITKVQLEPLSKSTIII